MVDSPDKTDSGIDSFRARKCLSFQVASTLYMVGVIWFVQVAHYPMFTMVGAEQFAAWEKRNVVLTTWVVAPGMLTEAMTALGLLLIPNPPVSRRTAIIGLILLAIIWLSTHFLQVPCHDQLATGFDADSHRFLVQSNWIRTIAWSLRGLLAIGWLNQICLPRAYREPK